MPQSIKVAIVAIAKNESVYLSDWIHHYFYFGFDGIYLGLNRTSDRSKDVIEKIKKHKKNSLYSYDLDWIDQGCTEIKNLNMQSLAYSYLTDCIYKSKTKYTHILYIDIDEFWICKDFKTDIKTYIKSLPNFDIVSFNWLMQNGDSELFSYPFVNLNYTPHTTVKSLIHLELSKKIQMYMPHSPVFSPEISKTIKRLDSDGKTFILGRNEHSNKNLPKKGSKAFIIHRAVRSEKEYIALLQRENPNRKLPIKNNRWGFKLTDTNILKLRPKYLKSYWESLENFLNKCEVKNIIIEARKACLSLDTIFDVDPQILAAHADIYLKVLDGTYKEIELLETLYKYKNFLLKSPKKSDFAPIFNKCAFFYQSKQNYIIALEYANLALLCRPDGPIIIAKHKELIKLLEKENKWFKKNLLNLNFCKNNKRQLQGNYTRRSIERRF